MSEYLEKAVNGSSYILDTYYQDQEATVEVDRWGDVAQANGSLKKENTAATYASRVPVDWGHQLRRVIESRAMEPAETPITVEAIFEQAGHLGVFDKANRQREAEEWARVCTPTNLHVTVCRRMKKTKLVTLLCQAPGEPQWRSR